ncbi:MAG: helix-turn-helix transcriptional regulator [Sphingomonadales bacterium]|nr:helix-turn-helix transcriptional regulator [Sphingomonadales bacterium]
MDIQHRLARNLRMLRAERQWTQEYVAFEGGLTQTYLSELERGTRNPSIGVLEKLATVFAVPPARLLDWPLHVRFPGRG